MQHFDQFFSLFVPTKTLHSIVKFALCLCVLRLIMLLPHQNAKKILFVLVNIAAVAMLYKFTKLDLQYMPLYFGGVLAAYLLTRSLAYGRVWLVATLMPILMLIIVRYATVPPLSEGFLGISYMAFRLSQLVVIVRNRIVPMPSILDYLGFAFFMPTVMVGPIDSYSTFIESFSKTSQFELKPVNCFLRMCVGAIKFLFLGNVLGRLTYQGLLMDSHAHPPIDLLVAAVAYYLYLYCNFSGFCDVMIGASGLLGIKVSENFDAPFGARNMKEFWNRWHITLSSFMRDMFFAPVSRTLVQNVPQSMSSHAIALTIALVFILIGLWHGRELNFLLFGIAHAIGVVANHYYGIWLKTHLTVEQRRSYNQNRVIKMVAVSCTFMYVCLTLFLFANSMSGMEAIFQHIQWHGAQS